MNYKRFWGAASAVLMLVIVITLMLAPGAWAASKYKTLHKFIGQDGGGPHASLIFDKAGNLYGTTAQGGTYGAGVVFKLTPNSDGSWMESVLYSFTGGNDGNAPYASLIFDATGNLYGTTLYGGVYECGTVFELSPNPDGSWTESVLYSFEDVYNIASPVIFDQSGNLYGMAQGGGAYDAGVVFKLAPNSDGSWTESVPHLFTNGNDGGEPYYSGVIFDQAGNLYGTTSEGGAYDGGVVFKLAPNSDGSWTESVLHSFRGTNGNGDSPGGSVTFDQAGNLYGTTTNGGAYGKGVVFKLTPNPDGTWKEKVLHQFTGGKDGSETWAALTFDQSGNLYGTTPWGGDLSCGPGCGVVFKLTPNAKGGWNWRLLWTFEDHPGAFPYAGVTLDAAGNLYGTTNGYGSTSFGSVFEITP